MFPNLFFVGEKCKTAKFLTKRAAAIRRRKFYQMLHK